MDKGPNITILKSLIVYKEESIKVAMKKITENGLGTIIVLDKNKKICGIVTDGDIRRAILKGEDIGADIFKITNKNPLMIRKDKIGNDLISEINQESFRGEIRKRGLNFDFVGNIMIPIANKEGRLRNVINVYKDGQRLNYKKLDKRKLQEHSVKRVLVIGGAGYLGSVLSRELLKRNYSVRVLDNLTYGNIGLKELYKEKKFEFFEGDMRSIENIVDAIKDADAVIHLGALVGDPASAITPQKTLEINHHSTKMIAEVCKYHQINRFIFASTASVYGRSLKPGEALTEDSDLNPVSLYARTKIESEKALLESMDENFSPTILRMATLFGYSPRMRFDLVVNILSAKGYFKKEIPIFGGEQYRPLVHVKDAANAYIKCLEAPIKKIRGEIFNIGSNRLNYKISDLGMEIKKIIPDATINIQKEDEDQRSYYVNFNKINEILKYKPKYSVADGIKELVSKFMKGDFGNYADESYSNYKSLISQSNLSIREKRNENNR